MKELVIFDLDGTLLNTIADLAISTNYALRRCGFPEHREEEYFHFVGNGITKLFERALPEECRSSDNVYRVRRYFLEYYSVHNTDYTRPYDKVEELLSVLNSQEYRHAVPIQIRNRFRGKNTVLTFGFLPDIYSTPQLFSHHENLKQTIIPPLYGVTWGFRSREELIEAGACHLVDSPIEILRLSL